MFVTKGFTFDSAHALTQYYGKCENLHGHTYRLEVTVEGPVHDNGMVVDFVLLKRIVKRTVLSQLDHQNLNDHFDNPSAENIALWIWDQLKDLPKLLKEEVEDPNLGEDLKRYLDETNDLDKSGLEGVKLYEVKLAETQDNIVTYRGL
jgi:6-pyruvoyltetrahydropterin/6-carboxytetrahydropterin synthase